MSSSRPTAIDSSDGWALEGLENGVATYRVRDWRAFDRLIEAIVHSAHDGLPLDLVWRGQRNPQWTLSPSVDRLLVRLRNVGQQQDQQNIESDEVIVARHLERFQLAVRGRRGANPPRLAGDNDWWALGQHYGLVTPLLDWTRAPFAAAYFAFEEEDHAEPFSDAEVVPAHRVVYGLVRRAVMLRNHELNHGTGIEGRPPVLEFYEPMSDENPRLVAQGGVFTRAPLGVSVEDWVATHFEESTVPILYRVMIPNGDRTACLRALNRMNINHLSLFPDLHGASRYVNLTLEDPYL